MMKPGVFILLLLTGFGTDRARSQTVDRSTGTGNVLLEFSHFVGERELNFDSTYFNPFGEQFTVSKFKYYISNIVFEDTLSGRRHVIKDGYFLVNEIQPFSKSIPLHVPPGKYNVVSFLIGVDSLKNVSGAQDGALDPINDMFWTWNSGYVMAKLEGASPVSKLPQQMIEFHIGGYKGIYNVLQSVRLPLKVGKETAIGGNAKTTIQFRTDINTWFQGTHDLRFVNSASCTSPGQLAKQYAENYRQMFSVVSIQYQ